jgi:hypothetical protein
MSQRAARVLAAGALAVGALVAGALVAGASGASGDLQASPALVLVVEDLARARTLHEETVAPGARLVLSYVHSSEHVAVRGTFRIERDGALTVSETAFEGFGPGLPVLAPTDDWRSEGGLFVLREPGTTVPALTVRVEPATRHRLVVPSGREIDLSAATGRGGAVRIRAGPAASGRSGAN